MKTRTHDIRIARCHLCGEKLLTRWEQRGITAEWVRVCSTCSTRIVSPADRRRKTTERQLSLFVDDYVRSGGQVLPPHFHRRAPHFDRPR
jgi:hypothetical protein